MTQVVDRAAALPRFYFFSGHRRGLARISAVATAILIYVLNSAFITAIQLIGGAIALQSL